ncbi:outer membrane beta-barrel protein [Acidobacteriota bacterium]
MKKIIILVLMIGMISVTATASFSLKGIYFLPSDADFKSIYGDSGWMFGGEIAIKIFKGVEFWLDGGYYAKTGSLTYSNEETKLTLIPIGAGLRYKFLTGKVEPYVGAGARYNLYKETSVIGDVSGTGLGFIGKAGLIFYLAKGFGVDISVAYSSCTMQPADFEFNVGGIELGAGITF